MEFIDVVRRRRMVRNYDPDRPVPDAVVDRLLDHAVRAPSAGFTQGWGFLVLDSVADRELFWAATTPVDARPGRWLAGMRRAPLIVVPHANRSAYLDRYAEPDKARPGASAGSVTAGPGASAGSVTARPGASAGGAAAWPVPYWHVDAGFATLLMLLTAVDEGLGACFFGIPAQRTDAYRAAFAVPVGFTPIGAVTVGYPAPDWRSKSLSRGRRAVAEVVHRGRWAPGA